MVEKKQCTVVKLVGVKDKFTDTGGTLPTEVTTQLTEAQDFFDVIVNLCKQMSLANPKTSFLKSSFEKARTAQVPLPLAAMCKDFDLRVNEHIAMTDYQHVVDLCLVDSTAHLDFQRCPNYTEAFFEYKVVKMIEDKVVRLARVLVDKDLAGPLDKAIKLADFIDNILRAATMVGADELHPVCKWFYTLLKAKATTICFSDLSAANKAVEDARGADSAPPLLLLLSTIGGGHVIWTWDLGQRRTKCEDG